MLATNYWALWQCRLADCGISENQIAAIIDGFQIDPNTFDKLAEFDWFDDLAGKRYFLLRPRMAVVDVLELAWLTHVLGVGLPDDYRAAGGQFPATPYSAEEIGRVAKRQLANRASYARFSAMVAPRGLQLVATPYGTLMGLGIRWPRSLLSQLGGTTYGDVFLVNIDHRKGLDSGAVLGHLITAGRAPNTRDRSGQTLSGLSLDRLLHHEEIHSRQYARSGQARFMASYAWQGLRGRFDGHRIAYEIEAGLADGGYE